MAKKKEAVQKPEGITQNKRVQGAWISIDDMELLKSEARKDKLRSATRLASNIIIDWCQKRRRELAEKILSK